MNVVNLFILFTNQHYYFLNRQFFYTDQELFNSNYQRILLEEYFQCHFKINQTCF